MKLPFQSFVFLSTSLGLLTIDFANSLPAKASIVCEPGTIRKYSNGSLARCILAVDTTVQVSSSRSGTANFPCKAEAYIMFDQEGQFEKCKLSEEIEITEGNSMETCPVDYWVSVLISRRDGTLSISCNKRYY